MNRYLLQPYLFIIFIALVISFFIFLIFLQFDIVTAAFNKLGISDWQGIFIFICTLVAYKINIPFYTSKRLIKTTSSPFINRLNISQETLTKEPLIELKQQVFAINLGGCVIPIILSLYFIFSPSSTFILNVPNVLYLLLSTLIITVSCYFSTKSRANIGFSINLFLPALFTFFTVFLLVPKEITTHVAYIGGTLGVLLGASILPMLNARRTSFPDAALLSIGGIGTFAGIILTQTIAVALL